MGEKGRKNEFQEVGEDLSQKNDSEVGRLVEGDQYQRRNWVNKGVDPKGAGKDYRKHMGDPNSKGTPHGRKTKGGKKIHVDEREGRIAKKWIKFGLSCFSEKEPDRRRT